jgi:hypothetical protein
MNNKTKAEIKKLVLRERIIRGIIIFAIAALVVGAVGGVAYVLDTVNKMARVSNMRVDSRSLQVPLETYKIDHGTYPNDHMPDRIYTNGEKVFGYNGMYALTTPVVYISSLFRDPYSVNWEKSFMLGSGADSDLDGLPISQSWVIVSLGPDGDLDSKEIPRFPWTTDFKIFDPTNGIHSSGDMFRVGGDYRDGTFTVEDELWRNWKRFIEPVKYLETKDKTGN